MKTSSKYKLKLINPKRILNSKDEKKSHKKDLTMGAMILISNSNCLKKAA
jgi:hypothetical protein